MKSGDQVLTDSKKKKGAGRVRDSAGRVRDSKEKKSAAVQGIEADAETVSEFPEEGPIGEDSPDLDPVEQLEVEKEELNQKYLRLLAEFDNYKKRTSRQFEEITRLANERIINALLDVLDNFSRALDAGRNSGDIQGLLKGVELIQNHFQDILKREGLSEIEAESQPFDPRYHEAVQHVTSEKLDPDLVVEEIQKGYTLGDRVIRPSKVAVSRRPDDRKPEGDKSGDN
jgi:molecular chaperone GrpE